MGRVIAQVNYSTDFTGGRSRAEKVKYAQEQELIPGFIWKYWLVNKDNGRGGGIFLFEDRASAEAWVEARKSRTFPASTTNITVELFDIDEELSRISHAPLDLVE